MEYSYSSTVSINSLFRKKIPKHIFWEAATSGMPITPLVRPLLSCCGCTPLGGCCLLFVAGAAVYSSSTAASSSSSSISRSTIL